MRRSTLIKKSASPDTHCTRGFHPMHELQTSRTIISIIYRYNNESKLFLSQKRRELSIWIFFTYFSPLFPRSLSIIIRIFLSNKICFKEIYSTLNFNVSIYFTMRDKWIAIEKIKSGNGNKRENNHLSWLKRIEDSEGSNV